MAKLLKRARLPDAHIDSTLVAAYALGAAVFAIWIAYMTRNVINPFWLGASIITLALYQVAIFWVMLQSWEIDRIMTIFAINILSLGMIMNLVSYILNVRLPVDLPVYSTLISLAGFEATSASPGAVGLSYAVLAFFAGAIMMFMVSWIENARIVTILKRKLHLDKADLRIDVALEKASGKIEDIPAAWSIAPLSLMVVAMIVVIGGAALI